VGDTKLIATGDDGPWEIYNLSTDRSEQKNLAPGQTELVNNLAAKWKSIDDDFTKTRETAPPSKKKLI